MLSTLAVAVAFLHCTYADDVFKRIGGNLDLDVKLPPFEFLYVVSPNRKPLCTIIKVNDTMTIFHGNQKFQCRRSTEIGNIGMSLTNITSEDGGPYDWSVGSMLKTRGTLLMLFVTDTPTTPTISLLQTPVFGKKVALTCNSYSTTTPATHPLEMRYQWLQNNQRLSNNSDIRISGDTLLIKHVRDRGQQQYQCLAKEADSESQLATLKFSPEYGPYNLDVNVSGTARPVEGSNLYVSCVADCKPSCKYTWLRNNNQLHGTDSGMLALQQVGRSQRGYYRCRASNTHGELDKPIQVDVQYQPEILQGVTFVPTQTINEGQKVDVRCDVDSNPAPTITWLKDDIVLKRKYLNGDVSHIVEDRHIFRNSFTKTTAMCEDGGRYKCQARNGVGNLTEETVTLRVNCSVRPDGDHHRSFITPTGTSLNVTLDVIAYPKPDFTGLKHVVGDKDVVVKKEKYTMTYVPKPKEFQYGFILTHVDMMDTDQEEYRTEISNGIGSSFEYRYNITVQVPPKAPEDLAVRLVGETYVSISWTAGFNGHAIQHFEISFRDATKKQSWTVDPTIIAENNTHRHLSGLDEGTKYHIRVRAWNDVGTSGYSNMAIFWTLGEGKSPQTDRHTIPAGQTTPRTISDHTSDRDTLMKDNGTFTRFRPESHGSRVTGIVFALIGTSVAFLVVSFFLFKGPLKRMLVRLGDTTNDHTRMSVGEHSYELRIPGNCDSYGGNDDGEAAGCSSRQSEHIYDVPAVMEGTCDDVPHMYLTTTSERRKKLEQPRQRTTCEF